MCAAAPVPFVFTHTLTRRDGITAVGRKASVAVMLEDQHQLEDCRVPITTGGQGIAKLSFEGRNFRAEAPSSVVGT